MKRSYIIRTRLTLFQMLPFLGQVAVVAFLLPPAKNVTSLTG